MNKTEIPDRLPRVEIFPVDLDPKAWGFNTREEMEAAFEEQNDED